MAGIERSDLLRGERPSPSPLHSARQLDRFEGAMATVESLASTDGKMAAAMDPQASDQENSDPLPAEGGESLRQMFVDGITAIDTHK